MQMRPYTHTRKQSFIHLFVHSFIHTLIHTSINPFTHVNARSKCFDKTSVVVCSANWHLTNRGDTTVCTTSARNITIFAFLNAGATLLPVDDIRKIVGRRGHTV